MKTSLVRVCSVASLCLVTVAYSAQLSMDRTTWSAPVAQGAGAPTTVMQFAPSEAKFIRITQTGTAANDEQWANARVRVYTGTR